jgi:EAL domain-containing protein (putative c-di-GMP-specific phosphodiesterase class I)
MLFSEGERGEVAYIIESGKVNLARADGDEALHIAIVGAGELVGEMALIDDSPRSATATADEETEVFIIDRDLLRLRLRQADPMLRLLMRVVLDRLRDSHLRLLGQPIADRAAPGAAMTDLGRTERRAIRLFKFEHELKRGLSSGEFELTLQPIVDLESRVLVGFEALMAWHHPERGRLSPSSFMAIAERSGLVRELDDLALRQAMRAMKHLREADAQHRPLRISVNLSGVHADDHDTVDRVRRALAEEAFPADALTLEITESWLVQDPERAQATLGRLKDLGLDLALDDFGTGYSSLGYLHRFPIDYLKVDRSFTQNMLTSEGSSRIVRAVIALAHSFELKAIAEGIDDPKQIEALREMGCEYGQGYLFSRPLDAAQAQEYLRQTAS